jgi:hypothetical protein
VRARAIDARDRGRARAATTREGERARKPRARAAFDDDARERASDATTRLTSARGDDASRAGSR